MIYAGELTNIKELTKQRTIGSMAIRVINAQADIGMVIQAVQREILMHRECIVKQKAHTDTAVSGGKLNSVATNSKSSISATL